KNIWIKAHENCIYIDYTDGSAKHNKLCDSRKGYVCDIYCLDPIPKFPLFQNNIWNCSTKTTDKMCDVSCKEGSVLEGADKVICLKWGWVDAYNKTTKLPICRDESEAASDLISWLDEFRRKQYRILFVVDEAITISTKQWWQQLKFVAALMQAFP
ncbi:hypothetical protein ILUMI_15315, partial [Ignelater luminosus]